MARTLDAILSVARERISGANPAGRNTGSPEATKTGDSPGIDYAAKSSGDRAFVAKHTHIEQEYPNGMAPVFKGEPVTYSMNDEKMKNYGNKEAEAVAANEEVQIDELDRSTLSSYRKKAAAQYHGGADARTKEKRGKGLDRSFDKLAKHSGTAAAHKIREDVEPIDEVSKASLARVKKAAGVINNIGKPEPKKDVKEDAEQIDEISKGLASRYKKKAHSDYWKSEKTINSTSDKATANKHLARQSKRYKGIENADKRLKEDIQTTDKSNTKPIQTSGPVKKPGPTQKGTPVHNPLENEAGKKVVKFKEEAEVLDEKLTDKAKGHIRTALDNKSIKSGSKPARALIALAKSNPKNVKEDAEQIDELNKATLKSYVKKAGKSAEKHFAKGGSENDKAMSTDGHKYPAKQAKHTAAAKHHDMKYKNRTDGIKKAESRLKEDVVDEGILTCKDSLGRKLEYHKTRMKNEEIGSVKFKHHQKQIHIIKTMREEAEAIEEKKGDGDKDVIKYDKRGFAMKKRKYGKSNKKDENGKVIKEDTNQFENNLLRAIEQITKDIS